MDSCHFCSFMTVFMLLSAHFPLKTSRESLLASQTFLSSTFPGWTVRDGNITRFTGGLDPGAGPEEITVLSRK